MDGWMELIWFDVFGYDSFVWINPSSLWMHRNTVQNTIQNCALNVLRILNTWGSNIKCFFIHWCSPIYQEFYKNITMYYFVENGILNALLLWADDSFVVCNKNRNHVKLPDHDSHVIINRSRQPVYAINHVPSPVPHFNHQLSSSKIKLMMYKTILKLHNVGSAVSLI